MGFGSASMRDANRANGWSGGGLTSVPECPLCGSNDRHSLGVAKDAMQASADDWPLWRCSRCRSAWLDPRPDDASISAAYDFDYMTHRAPQTPSREGRMASLIDGYLNYRFKTKREAASRLGAVIFSLILPLRLKLNYFGRHLSPSRGGRLLDVGCGNGDFVVLAKTMGWAAEGVDPDEAAIKVCRNRGIVVTHGFIEDLPQEQRHLYWHAITMSHSLEHVVDPQNMLKNVFDMLAPGGTLWIGLPNPEAIGARFYGLDWESYDVPRHLTLPAIDILKKVCLDAGFELVEARNRGAHTRRLYKRSAEIARARAKKGIRGSAVAARLLSIIADLLATISVRYAEETVIVARKAYDAPQRSS